MAKPSSWVVDPLDPRAPPEDVWSAMSDEERAAVIESLPSEIETQPEGDEHRDAKENARDPLRGFFERIGRRVYLSSELPVYYPGEPMFAPDLIAVVDVDPRKREKWVVADEERGIDLALEVNVSGSYAKDVVRNVEWLARLGIPEYFVYEPLRGRLRGWALRGGGESKAASRSYRPLLGQGGRFTSEVLGLELGVEDSRLRFYYGGAIVPETRELLDRANRMLSEISSKLEEALRRAEDEARRAEDEARRAEDEARRAEDEARRAEDEARRAREEAKRAADERARRERLERELAEARAEIERLRRQR